MSNDNGNGHGNGKHFCSFVKERDQITEALAELKDQNLRIEEKLDRLLILSIAYSDELMQNNYKIKTHTRELEKLAKKIDYFEVHMHVNEEKLT
jgi:hypothetical protein